MARTHTSGGWSRWALRAAACGMVGLAASVSSAQTDLQPPRPQDPPKGSIVTVGLAIICIGAVVVSVMMPPKRGHQD